MATGSYSARKTPREGDRRLHSAMTFTRSTPESAARNLPERSGAAWARSAIQQHYIERRTSRTGKHALDDACILLRVAPLQRSRGRLGQTHIRRVQIERVDRTVAAFGNLGVARGRQFVDAVRAVHDPGAL